MEEKKKVFIDSRLEKDYYWIVCIGIGGFVGVFGLLYMIICLMSESSRIEHCAGFFGFTSISLFLFALAERRRIKHACEYEAREERKELRRRQRQNKV